MKNEKDIFKYISKLTYDSHNLFDKNIVGIHENKIYLTLSKPIYVECTVLEISKLAIHDFQSNFMKKFFNQFKLLFTDNDNLCYEDNEDFYEKFYEQTKDSKYFSNDNKKVLGKMKDELEEM